MISLRHNDKGFTLIELMVVISIIGVLSTIVLGSLQHARLAANDSKRIQEIQQMQTALELYLSDYGQYPSSDEGGCGGYDTPGNGSFLAPLAAGGYLPNLQDPTTNDTCGNYRYYRYTAADAAFYGCNPTPFYVLEIVSLSVTTVRNPGFTCRGRDWTPEGAYVVGKYES